MMIRDMMRNGVVAALAFGLIAAGVAIAADRPVDPEVKPAAITAGRMLTARVRFVEMPGLEWKDAAGPKLKRVKSLPGFKVWTCESDVVTEFIKDPRSEIKAPRITFFEGDTGTVQNVSKQRYVAAGHWEFQGDGAAFRPRIGELTDGISLTISGRKIDQGMLVRVGVDDQRVLGFDTVAIPARVNETEISGQIQIPSTTKLKQDGEWLIPNGGMLVLSTGSYHAEPPRPKTNLPVVDFLLDELGVTDWLADKNYWSSSVVERLVVIDAKSFEEPVAGPVKVSRAASAR